MNTQDTFYDIYDYIFVPFWQTKPFIISSIAVAVILLAITAYFIIRWVKKKNAMKKVVTPAEWALEQLRALKPEQYQKKEEFKQFYFTITKIIKSYLKRAYNLDTIEKTDEELIRYLRDKEFHTLADKLEEVFNSSLLIKFANAQALREQAQKDLLTIISLIHV
jgi:hypothetical protein